MIITLSDGQIYLVIEHAEVRLVDRAIDEDWIVETLSNPDIMEPSKVEGRTDYLKDFETFVLKVVTEPDDFEEFDGIIVTIIKKVK